LTVAVVKLGGSSATAASLPRWLAAIEASTLPLVLVPGGGPFADTVRETQPVLGFSEHAAHEMAMLAMEQFGCILIDRAARLEAARTVQDIRAVLDSNRIPVWFPAKMTLNEPAIPASWDVTSDSLAAWLSTKLSANALLLIKQTDDFGSLDNPEALSARGIVDSAFPDLIGDVPALHLAGPRHLPSAAESFAQGGLPGEKMSRTAMKRAG